MRPKCPICFEEVTPDMPLACLPCGQLPSHLIGHNTGTNRPTGHSYCLSCSHELATTIIEPEFRGPGRCVYVCNPEPVRPRDFTEFRPSLCLSDVREIEGVTIWRQVRCIFALISILAYCSLKFRGHHAARMILRNREDETKRLTKSIFDNIFAIRSGKLKLRQVRGEIQILEAEIKDTQFAFYQNMDKLYALEAELRGLEQRVRFRVHPIRLLREPLLHYRLLAGVPRMPSLR